MNSFKQEFNWLLETQLKSAEGQRLERLKRDLSGTKSMLEVAVWPVLKSLKGITLRVKSAWQS